MRHQRRTCGGCRRHGLGCRRLRLAIRENDTDGNTAEYIPVVAWDGTSGLYETVSGTYYPNVGTGTFAAGPTIATSTGTGAWIGSSAAIALATPWIENPPTVVRNADGTYTVSATLDSGMGSVSTVYNDIVTNLLAAAATGPAAFSDTPAGLSPDTTYAYATFASGLGVERYVAGTNTFLTGDVFLGATTDADETGLVPGAFTIVRPATAMQHDLVVNYSLARGTAVAGVNFVDNLTGSVVIPEGSASATIAVTPLLDTATHADTTLTLTLAPGLYGIGAASSASIAIRELSVPEGTNVWIATAAGLASDGANWSAGHAPLASDNVLVDGRYSTFDMEWDAAAGATVASWTQTASYTGTVIFDTLYPDVAEAVFTNFTVTGAAVIDGGVWTHPVSFDRPDNWTVFTAADQRAGRTYRLCVSAQTLTIGAGGAIDVVGKGHSQKNTRGQSCALFCAHGGMIEGASSVGCYGDPKFPEDLGYASNWGTDHVSKDAAGGGAVKLAVAGACVVDGDIRADGEISTGHVTAGSAGSILIEAESISGTGSIHADGVFMGNTSYNNGCGGRVALLTTDPVDRGTLSVTAAGTTSGRGAANGTVYFHDATMAYGVLRIENAATTRYDTFSVQTTVDGDWTFDAVHLRGSTFFTVPAGTSLTLPNGLASVHSTAAHAGNLGICCNGGDIVLPAGTQTLSGPWTFGTTVPFTFSCPVVLTDGVRLMAYTTLPAQENGDPGRIYNIQGDLSAETGTVIDFRGNQFRVQTAHIAGATVPAGVYLPGDFGSILTDTSESQGGELIVTGGSTVILFQ